jgi:hypothetical protein
VPAAVRPSDELITPALPFIPGHFEPIPQNFDGFIKRNIMIRQLFFVEFVLELAGVELLPVDQPTDSKPSFDRPRSPSPPAIACAFPTTYGVPTLASTFASAPAYATGVSAVAELNGEKHPTICQAGHGGTYDIGIATLSAAAERNEDILYIC